MLLLEGEGLRVEMVLLEYKELEARESEGDDGGKIVGEVAVPQILRPDCTMRVMNARINVQQCLRSVKWKASKPNVAISCWRMYLKIQI